MHDLGVAAREPDCLGRAPAGAETSFFAHPLSIALREASAPRPAKAMRRSSKSCCEVPSSVARADSRVPSGDLSVRPEIPARSIRGGEIVARESQLSAECVLAGDLQELVGIRRGLRDGLSREAVSLQHLLGVGERGQRGAQHSFKVD